MLEAGREQGWTLLAAGVGADRAASATVALGAKTAPHTAVCERGVAGARVPGRVLRGEIDPVLVIEKPPVLIKGG